MKLTQIKLAGFKSFVDPTTFMLPGMLVGVVGPNGCGKSNIIDAVRWVLGESKASELRGESMQDVIFNGSNQRKASSRASVELIFENLAGRAGGQWNQYQEIAVKRILTRDGTSTYYINQQQVRRRDIQDIFLGTGLGPRAYAIIGQGMIAKIIEAKPEELRIFLEEAAGISKYKERRRETENRLADTRDNLVRVQDILRELNTNVEKLQAQADVARQYRALQAEGEEKQHLLWLMKRNEAQQEAEKLNLDVESFVKSLAEQSQSLEVTSAELDELRLRQQTIGESLHVAQADVYQVNADVTRLQTEIKHITERRARAEQQLVQLQTQITDWQTRSEEAQISLETDSLALEEAQALSEEAQEKFLVVQESFPDQERKVTLQREAVDAARTKIQRHQQAIDLAKLGLEQTIRHAEQTKQKFERLNQEKKQLQEKQVSNDSSDEGFSDFDQLTESVKTLKVEVDDLTQQLNALQKTFPDIERQKQLTQQQYQQSIQETAQLKAKLEALTHLQSSVQASSSLKPWLKQHGFDALAPLWQLIQIKTGAELALESVLRERLHSLQVDATQFFEAIKFTPPGKLSLYCLEDTPTILTKPSAKGVAVPMIELVSLQSNAPEGLLTLLHDWLKDIYFVVDLKSALSVQSLLADHELIVLPQGHILGANTIQFYAPDAEQAGVLARQQEIEQLRTDYEISIAKQANCQSAFEIVQTQADDDKHAIERMRLTLDANTKKLHQAQLNLLTLTQQKQQIEQRQHQIDDELDELVVQLESVAVDSEAYRAKIEHHEMELELAQETFLDIQAIFVTQEDQLRFAREQLRELERVYQSTTFKVQTIQNQINIFKRDLGVAAKERERLRTELDSLREEMSGLENHVQQVELEKLHTIRIEKEAVLLKIRTELDELTQQLRARDEMRLQLERQLEPLRQKITEYQLKAQAASLSASQYSEQLTNAQVDEAQLSQKLASHLKVSTLQTDVTRIQAAIIALGAVNLAALEELNQAAERQTFLETQSADLTEAMHTLEDAIHKIDIETRSLLTQTFDAVNHHFGILFPTLFGGGEAKLVMTGEEILDAGVQVMAQPPGKKNSTIHLLSGGEKALTATALVFSLFQLNPAPFCLLDEVDAPLDDANTERYINMVKKMSENTQFVFISHNKIAMEKAEQLIGVTMQEQGVSRIVAVDVERAVSMVQ